ncbi:hypothetical protein BpHYR1_035696 [Brachionus plicatilis]|uniref:Uncharacterized protein n=1 Tax=Brachionus plicatilis TaxID=10195 RepID=A0A3M7Q276_BRAPC|nr:hypothetical protein BpHYR1_035696 [Brachionus plicatilis]
MNSAPAKEQIKVLMYNEDEMGLIEDHGLRKDKFFSQRFLFNLKELKAPKNLINSYTKCTRKRMCTLFELYSINVIEKCSDKLNGQFYSDCFGHDTKLLFNISLSTERSGIFYNCEVIDGSRCRPCNLNSLQPFLVQEDLNNLDVMKMAWYEFLNCNTKTKLFFDKYLGFCQKQN